jgi:HPt (histidine-containing phosphotransfer) domain-containing protein
VSGLPPPNASIAELASGLGLEDARDLVRLFLDSFDETLAALSAKDLTERRRAAHSLKSSARIVGLLGISQQMAELELRLSSPPGDVTPADISAARKEFETVAPALRAFSAPASG